MTASPAATTNAIALAQIGMVIPFTVTSQPETTRSNCSKATRENTTIAMVVNGFTGGPTLCDDVVGLVSVSDDTGKNGRHAWAV